MDKLSELVMTDWNGDGKAGANCSSGCKYSFKMIFGAIVAIIAVLTIENPVEL